MSKPSLGNEADDLRDLVQQGRSSETVEQGKWIIASTERRIMRISYEADSLEVERIERSPAPTIGSRRRSSKLPLQPISTAETTDTSL